MSGPGIVLFVSGSVDNFLNTFVTQTSSQVSAAIAPLVATGASIWMLAYGFAVLRGEVNAPMQGFFKAVLKFAIIFGIALVGGTYQSFVVDGVNSVQNGFVTMIAPNSAGNIFGVLDAFDENVSELSLVIIGHGMTLFPFGGWLDMIAGIVVLVGSAFMIIICGGFALVAKFAIAFMLGLGPIFVMSLAFPPIAKWFESWMGKVMNYTFLIIGLALTVTMCVTICAAYVAHFQATQSDTQDITDAFGLIIAEGMMLILVWQMPSIASGLGGGAALSGGGVGAFIGGMVTQSLLKGKGGDMPKPGGPTGGSIKNDESGNGGGKGQGGTQGGKADVPAYRQATLQRLADNKMRVDKKGNEDE